MRGKILLKALEILKDGVISQIDFFEAVLASGYGASMNKIDYEYRKCQRVSEFRKYNEEDLRKRRRRLQVFISKLKHDGLIKEVKNKLTISNAGRKKILDLKNNLPDRHYQTENQRGLVIISFDIPEKLRRKRNWLREVVKNLQFGMVHKSVWIGKVKIPHEFILDLELLKIIEFVEIFEIGKTGTLKKMENF
ncbi:hypothetical protein A3A95_01970 [Candidatus Nomurabacteria bacterium RIFCSPLOWO2_01_FULL_39_18]|uniref:Transcriptional repressor PaaX-like central Cas2-like domain-containing protein n=1 Tax=Candidatus Nomurabacteria bacterium RIFCSPHIGHO2_01_FULL_40_24b TaxID=1801739 RepID=A0A1F6V9D6_9BACT|nr:MAG: hypothetical protein A2647_00745 [Candidatus Nomurabacteria bacterium RIFCSPHIGHO2_01_FULL_40_24b]OGI90631.1 MAG: hypothetical protein A3A95_01970 [Candidatus Nomurabacteria bacterium RIFCSPLOWO2_01_FULL_39_18]